VQIVALLELAAERSGEQRCDCGLSRSGDPHDHNNHWLSDRVR